MIRKALGFAAVTFTGMLMVGCCSTTKLNVTVSVDDAMRQRLKADARTIQVDLVALNSKQAERWEGYSMTEYWKPGDAVRDSVPTYKMIFNPDNAQSQTLSKNDPIWNKWLANAGEGQMQLYVLALLPGFYDDAPGDKDARRQILPLASCRWSSTDVKMLVQKTGIITQTPPKPAK